MPFLRKSQSDSQGVSFSLLSITTITYSLEISTLKEQAQHLPQHMDASGSHGSWSSRPVFTAHQQTKLSQRAY